MTTTVVIPSTMSYDGTTHTYTDDSDPTTGLDGGGHVDRFVPAMKDLVAVAAYTTAQIGDIPAAVAGALDTQIIACNGYATDAYNSSITAETSKNTVLNTAANLGSMLGINFGSWEVNDGELIVSHLSTTTPSIVNGELILTYETL